MILNIQILRAFAALNVVFYHVIGIAEKYGRPVSLFSFMDGWGRCGVDIFFVLSGFVVVHSYNANPKSPGDFFLNRFVRVVPVYWSLILFLFLLNLFFPSLFLSLDLSGWKWIASVLFVSGFFGYSYPVINVGWSLEYEVMFYFLLTLVFFVSGSAIRILLLTFFISLLVFFGAFQLMALEFVFGILCAYFCKNKKLMTFGSCYFLVGSLLLLLSIFYRPDLDRLFLYGVPSFLVVLGLIDSPSLKSRMLAFLGDASYSIYLIQFFSISMFYKVFQNRFLILNDDVLSVVALIFSAFLGCAFYLGFERPLTKFLKYHLIPKKSV